MRRVVVEVQRQRPEGILPPHARRLFSFVGILLLSALALSIGARRPYLCRVSPAAHTAQASKMTEAGHEAIPRVQPGESPAFPDEPPRVKPPFPIRETVFRRPPGIFRAHTLRSPPII
jgi:hypothetical protein